MSKKKVFVYSDYYKPGFLAGGPIQSISNMCELITENSFYIYTQNFDLNNRQNPYQLQSNAWLTGGETANVFYTGRKDYLFSSWKQLWRVKPQVIYFNSLFSTATQSNLFQALWYVLFHKSKIIIAPRGELDDGAFSLKKTKKTLFLSLFKFLVSKKIVFHATTEKESDFIKGKLKNEVLVAENIPDIVDTERILAKQPDVSKFIFISRVCVKKNLLFALQCLKNIKIEGQLEFTIIGPLEDIAYWEKCQAIINQLPANVKCSWLGAVPHHEIHGKLAGSHYLLFPTMAENFGHIIYESLISGVPVIISDNTPWDNGYQNGVFAYPLNDETSFIHTIENLHKAGQADYDALSKNAFVYARSKVKPEVIKTQYFKLFN